MTDYGDPNAPIPKRKKAYIINEDGMIQIAYEVE